MSSRRGTSKQLIIECAVVGGLVLLVLGGGSLAAVSNPAWANLQNPVVLTTQTSLNLQYLAIYYNITLTSLGQLNFSSVSSNLANFASLSIPSKVQPDAKIATIEITDMNQTMSAAISDFNATIQYIGQKNFTQAKVDVGFGCINASISASTYHTFQNSTTTSLKNVGVPVSDYASGSNLVNTETQELNSNCSSLEKEIDKYTSVPSSIGFTISSPQKTITTGGSVIVNGNLTQSGFPIPGAAITFYFETNSSALNLNQTTTTSASGTFSESMNIPFVYPSNPNAGLIYAFANNTSPSFGKNSNVLNFTILYGHTSISLGDPSEFLPTASFNVNGTLTEHLLTKNILLNHTDITIGFFGASYPTKTNGAGWFNYRVTIPANATNGNYTVTASFASSSFLGPSFNATTFEVYHDPITIDVQPSGLSLSGLSTELSGQVLTNATKLAGANITISTPWGAYQTTTNKTGGFSLRLHVPITVFAFGQTLSVAAVPAQPYVESGAVQFPLRIFNLLWIAFPAVTVAVAIYEGRSLNLIPRLRRRSKQAGGASQEESAVPEGKPEIPFATEELVNNLITEVAPRIHSKIVEIYRESLALAAKQFNTTFKISSTIREITEQVRNLGRPKEVKSERAGSEYFAQISQAMEDYLYAPVFDEDRVAPTELLLEDLRALWGADEKVSDASGGNNS